MRWFNRFIHMPLFAQADTGGDGGVADGADPDAGDEGDAGDDAGDTDGEATEGDGADGEHADDADGQGGSHPDDDDEALNAIVGDDEDPDDARPLEERHKALRKSHNKLRKRFGKAWPLVQTLKKQGITDVNDVVVGSRNWNALLERVGGDRNKLNRLLDSLDGENLGDGKKPAATTRGNAAADDDDEFDEKAFDKLWNTTTESGKFFVKLARKNHEQGKALKAAQTRLDQLEGGIRTDKDTAVKSSWLGVMNAASKTIKDTDTREIYEDLMKSAFFVARTKGQNIDPTALSRTVLKKLKVEPTTARIADNAAKQRMAQNNQGRPKHQAGGGQPNPAKAKKETVDEVNRRIRRL